ncbi:restriction endonuclease subunit S domain-containing protein [Gemella sp. Musashino-2025]
MSKIDELLKDEKVEWKKLGEVCNIKRGRVISKIYLEERKGEFPVYSSQTRNNGEIGRISTYDFDGEFATWTTDGAYAGTVFYRNGKFSVTNICGLIEPKDNKKLLVKFIVYWLQIEAKKHVKGGSGNPKLMSNVVERIKIPIPSIETQEKIVKTLDKFTNYVTELQARTKQYEYYRDMLLSEEYLNKISAKIEGIRNNGEISFYTLSQVFNTKNGYTPSKSVQEYWNSKDIPWFKMEDIRENGNILSYVKNYVSNSAIKGELFEQNSIILSTSATIGEHALITVPFLANQRFTCFSLKDNYKKEVNIKYAYYYFYIIDKWCSNNIKIGNFPSVDVSILLTQTIPIPDIEIQNKIVEILDRFQSLLADTKGLLPQEIEQRQKQYGYYREKLLSFKR